MFPVVKRSDWGELERRASDSGSNVQAELRSCRRNLAAVRASAHVAARPPTPPAGLVNTARTDAPAAVCTRQKKQKTTHTHTPARKPNPRGARDGLWHARKRTKDGEQVGINRSLQRNPRGSSSAGSKKKMFHTPPPPHFHPSVSLVSRSGGSRISAAAYRARSGGGSVQEAAPSTAVSIPALSRLLRRVIVVAISRRVLATDPCWHSFFPASRDGIKRHGSRSAALIGRARRRLALKGAL